MTMIYLINLDRRADRLAKMSVQFEKLGLDYTRIVAYDPAQGVRLAAELNWVVPSLSAGEIACALSHRAAWLKFLDTGDSHCVVFEDDLILSRALPAFLAARPFAGLDADIIRLETFRMRVRVTRRPEARWRRFGFHRQHSLQWGSGAYMLSRACAQRLAHGDYNRDMALDNVMFRPDSDLFATTKILQVMPALGVQEKRLWAHKGSSDSDLVEARSALRSASPPSPVPGRARMAKKLDRFLSRERLQKKLDKVRNRFGASETMWTKVPYCEKRILQWLTTSRTLERADGTASLRR